MLLRVLGCHGPYPCPGGAASGYLLTLPEGNILLDCGAGVMGKLLAVCDPAALKAIILTHLHYDHMSDLYVMRYYLDRLRAALPVYLPGAALSSPVAETLRCDAFSLRSLDALTDIAGAAVASIPVRHPVPARAVKIVSEGKTLVYTGDTNTCDGLTAFCADADVLLIDGALTDDAWREGAPHLSARLAARTAREANVKRLIVTHFIPENVPSVILKEAQSEYPGAVFAYPNMLVTV